VDAPEFAHPWGLDEFHDRRVGRVGRSRQALARQHGDMTAMKALDRHVGCRMHAILTHKNKVLEEPDVWLFPHILSLGGNSCAGSSSAVRTTIDPYMAIPI